MKKLLYVGYILSLMSCSVDSHTNNSTHRYFNKTETRVLDTVDTTTVTQMVKVNKMQIETLVLQPEEVIYLNGEVNQSIDLLAKQIDKANRDNKVKEIYLLIDSPGGSVLDGARFISSMEVSQKPVNTVCLAMCASMAAIIHQYGVKRYMIDRSFLMFHDASGALQGTLPQMQSRLTFITRLTNKLDAHVAKRVGIKFDRFLEEIKGEIWVDAEDATDKKYNDQIVYVTVDGDDTTERPSLFTSDSKNKFDFYNK